MKNCVLLLLFALFCFQYAKANPCQTDEPVIEIRLKTSVDKLRLRQSPGLQSEILATLPKATKLHFISRAEGEPVAVDWQGGREKGYWYLVGVQNIGHPHDPQGWVFSRGVSLDYIIVPPKIPLNTLKHDFFSVQEIDKAAFEREYALYQNRYVDAYPVQISPDSIFVGKSGYPDAGVFLESGESEGEIYSVWFDLRDMKTGRLFELYFGRSDTPLLSPDNQWFAAAALSGCEGFSMTDVVVKEAGEWVNAFSFEHPDRMAKRMAWAQMPRTLIVEWGIFSTDERDTIPLKYYRISF